MPGEDTLRNLYPGTLSLTREDVERFGRGLPDGWSAAASG